MEKLGKNFEKSGTKVDEIGKTDLNDSEDKKYRIKGLNGEIYYYTLTDVKKTLYDKDILQYVVDNKETVMELLDQLVGYTDHMQTSKIKFSEWIRELVNVRFH